MKIGIIGYKGHSLKLLKILKKNFRSGEFLVYCRKIEVSKKLSLSNGNSKLSYTSTLDHLYDCAAVFISSSSSSHVNYIKKISGKGIYIFCEKPSFTHRTDYNYLKNFSRKEKNKLYFNFNFKKSKLFLDLKNILSNKSYGKVVHFNIDIAHGLAFKKEFKDNWRLKSSNIFDNISGNLGIHYLNLLEGLIGDSKKIDISLYSSKNKNRYDTALIIANYKKNITSKIFLTYASAYTKKITIYMTNATVEFEENKLSVFYPRDTFNKKGLFKKPNSISSIKYNSDFAESSLELSVKYFIDTLIKNKPLSLQDYDAGLMSSINILNAKINRQ